MNIRNLGSVLLLVALTACDANQSESQQSVAASPPADSSSIPAAPSVERANSQFQPVTDERLGGAADEPHNWLSHGRTYDEQRFSPLTGITDQNVVNLKLAWFQDLDYKRGIEATPIVVDGVLITTSSWSVVHAFDAASGDPLWKFDPKVPHSWGQYACCDVVNRGVAVWGNKVFVGALDGHLIAIDLQTGEEIWRKLTIDPSQPYTITGAPRVVKGKVMIGNGGSEWGVRGYISAYDAATGEMVWRFYTIPGNPAEPIESEALEMAAKTWADGEWWKMGGGGTVWDAMAFDPELDLFYFGVGNGSPWPAHERGQSGQDNLFLSSIVAVRPDTGEYVWHYQTTPGDSWDFTATQHIILADLDIQGEARKVLMQAPKNGFFYVLDRATGELISAENYVPVSWASHIDMATGRPVLTQNEPYGEEPVLVFPGPGGGHNWHPMAFSPETGLVYIPAQELPFPYALDPEFKYKPGYSNYGVNFLASMGPKTVAELEPLMAFLKGRILAWNPVTQKAEWAVEHAGPWNGGILATAGNLIFQGTPAGEFAAYTADAGKKVWSWQVQTGALAGPISYAVGDEQYIAITVGWGTAMGMAGGALAEMQKVESRSRMLAFKLHGRAQLPPIAPSEPRALPPAPEIVLDESQVAAGQHAYYNRGHCSTCHGDNAISGGQIPDLRYATPATHDNWNAIVIGGQRNALGMPGFAGVLTEAESEAIQMYVLSRRQELISEVASPK